MRQISLELREDVFGFKIMLFSDLSELYHRSYLLAPGTTFSVNVSYMSVEVNKSWKPVGVDILDEIKRVFLVSTKFREELLILAISEGSFRFCDIILLRKVDRRSDKQSRIYSYSAQKQA